MDLSDRVGTLFSTRTLWRTIPNIFIFIVPQSNGYWHWGAVKFQINSWLRVSYRTILCRNGDEEVGASCVRKTRQFLRVIFLSTSPFWGCSPMRRAAPITDSRYHGITPP